MKPIRSVDASGWESRAVSAEEAVARIGRGMRVFLHGAAATPTPLVEALCGRMDLEGVLLYHLHTQGPAPFAERGVEERVRSVSFFAGAAVRTAIAEGRADFIPVFLSDIPGLFRSRAIPLDAAIVQVSPPDRHGVCSLGTSVDAARAAVDEAGMVIAEINVRMPRTHGAATLPLARIDAFVATDRPLHESVIEPETPVTARIGELIAELVEDGSTIQTGIGAIPNAVLARLGNKVGLGVHTEMFSDGLIPLMEGGVVTNAHKAVHPGRTVTSFVAGSRRLFDFVDDNPLVEFHPCDRTNDTNLLRKLDRLVAVNSAIQIDLTGQVCADSIGHRIYSGIGGQMDFLRGAALSRGGKAMLAFPATAMGGKVSRIVHELTPGAGVVTSRGHVQWVVTEYGAVNLHGMSLRQRADALVGLAHPDFRAGLRREMARGG
ncbi:MAG: Acyl-CoA hydrolase [Verrucomicrobia bacterium]|nr:MAG: Acyl-CoA hydrolase [Verrucomicrobiota bacterium]